jgi:hypothetical protein
MTCTLRPSPALPVQMIGSSLQVFGELLKGTLGP